MSPEDNEKANELLQLIKQLQLEYKDTNFDATYFNCVSYLKKYNDEVKKKGRDAFPDRESYQMFAISKLFADRMQYLKFQNKNALVHTEDILKDNNMLPLEAFHGRAIKQQDFKQGDILHLQVVEDSPEYKLLIINKYGDKKRLIDSSLFAVLFKTNTLVQEICPPLQVADFVRAVVFGNAIVDQDGTKKWRMSINPRYINDMALRNLKLGRVFKNDIPFYPEDLTTFQSLSKYFESQNYDCAPQISAGGSDPTKACPLWQLSEDNVRLPLHFAGMPDDWILSDEAEVEQKIIYCGHKSKHAEEALLKGDLQAAMFEIQEAISSFPRSDVALTIRGKIYLSMAGHTCSSHVKASIQDIEAALKINYLNKEAVALRDVIIMQSIMRFEKEHMLTKADELRALMECADNTQIGDFMKSIKPLKKTKQTTIIPTDSDITEEKMDISEET